MIGLLAPALPPVLILRGLAAAVRIDTHIGKKQKTAMHWMFGTEQSETGQREEEQP